METGSCIIDTVDLSAYGIFIIRGGSDDLISFPDRRTPDQNDWAEHDGLDVDLSECCFDAKTVQVGYVIAAPDEAAFLHRLNSFQTLHFAPGLRRMYVREFNRTFSLRFTGFVDYRHRGGLYNPRRKTGETTAGYSMDDPLQFLTGAIGDPVSARPSLAQVTMNGYDLSRFGIVVRDIYSTALRPHAAKEVLTRKMDNLNGLIADTVVAPKKQGRQITIECTMLAGTLTEFWVNYSALFNNLSRPAAVRLGITRTGSVLDCYYSKMTDFKKETPFSRKVRVSFNLILQEI